MIVVRLSQGSNATEVVSNRIIHVTRIGTIWTYVMCVIGKMIMTRMGLPPNGSWIIFVFNQYYI